MKFENAKALDKTALSHSLPGAVVTQFRRCGKPNCRCANGQLHGPYYYRTWRRRGKQHWQYVKRKDVQAVREACEAHRVLQEERRWIRAQIKMFFQRSRELLWEVEEQLCRKH